MIDFYNKNKKFVIATIILIIVIVWVAIFYYRKGKNQIKIVDPNLLPDGSPGGTTGASNDEIKNVANSLYDDMKGFNYFGHKDQPYKSALFFNDKDLIKLYNTYNSLYQLDTNETLTLWLQHEYFSSDETFGPLLRDKLLKLNLK